jgi:type 1 fimbriae regulatory protein FimB
MKANLSKAELLLLLGAAKKHSERDWLMILVAFNHGLRASEVTAITKASVRDGALTVQRLKGSLATTQPLISHPNPLLNERSALFALAAETSEKQRLFPVSRQHFWRIVQRHGRAAGIALSKAHPHALKHAVAMQLIGKAGIENTRQYLGHRSISSTGEYLRVTDDQASRRAARALGAR